MKEFTDERKRVIAVILEMMVLCLGVFWWPRSVLAAVIIVSISSYFVWQYYSKDPKRFMVPTKIVLFFVVLDGLGAVWIVINPVVAIVTALVLLALRYGRIEKK